MVEPVRRKWCVAAIMTFLPSIIRERNMEKPKQDKSHLAEKKRYIVGHRYGPRIDPQSKKEMESFVASADDISLVRSTLVGRMVFDMTETQMHEFAEKHSHLVIEEDDSLELYSMPGLPPRIPAEGKFAKTVQVKDSNSGKSVRHAVVYGIGNNVAYKGVTNAKGSATIDAYEARLSRIIVSPQDSYWSQVVGGTEMDKESLPVKLKPLLVTGAYDWGHRLMGFRTLQGQWTGRETKIGIIDTGISDQLEDFKPSGGYNPLLDQDRDAWNEDQNGHGTHVAGIIGAVNDKIGVSGVAPNSKIFALKVFPGGCVSDLVEAIEWCIHQRMDVVSISTGVRNPSRALAGVLTDAYDRGIVCVAASGNENGPLAYPASHPTVVSVGAIGRFNTFPSDSAHAMNVGQFRDWHGDLFSASFSNYGPEIDLCAPGVAILSTVPTGYAAWDGTSMACSFISGLIALIIEAYPELRTGDAVQAETVKSILLNSCVDLGMPWFIQGCGLPLATEALAEASLLLQAGCIGA
jgi:subtilisin family serine protease